jgi:hypothetical protein
LDAVRVSEMEPDAGVLRAMVELRFGVSAVNRYRVVATATKLTCPSPPKEKPKGAADMIMPAARAFRASLGEPAEKAHTLATAEVSEIQLDCSAEVAPPIRTIAAEMPLALLACP